MICGLRDVGAIPTILPAQAAALAVTEAALSSILLVNRFAAFRCTVELRHQVLPCLSSSGASELTTWILRIAIFDCSLAHTVRQRTEVVAAPTDHRIMHGCLGLKVH